MPTPSLITCKANRISNYCRAFKLCLLHIIQRDFYIEICLIMKTQTRNIYQLTTIHRQKNIWAATWQNQQNECAPSEDSDQPGHPPSLISLRCALSGQLRTPAFFMRTAKTLIRLSGCPDWSESSLGAHSFCWFVMSRLISASLTWI